MKGMELVHSLLGDGEKEPVVMFARSNCERCKQMKKVFNIRGVYPKVYEVDVDPRGKEIEKALKNKVRQGDRSIPVVYVKGDYVGTLDQVMVKAVDQSLDNLLRAAKLLQ